MESCKVPLAPLYLRGAHVNCGEARKKHLSVSLEMAWAPLVPQQQQHCSQWTFHQAAAAYQWLVREIQDADVPRLL